jgi:hypothetical protein
LCINDPPQAWEALSPWVKRGCIGGHILKMRAGARITARAGRSGAPRRPGRSGKYLIKFTLSGGRCQSHGRPARHRRLLAQLRVETPGCLEMQPTPARPAEECFRDRQEYGSFFQKSAKL